MTVESTDVDRQTIGARCLNLQAGIRMTTDRIDRSAPATHDEVMAKIEKLAARFDDRRAPKRDDPATAVALDAWGERFITYLRIWDLRISSVLSRIESCELRTLGRIAKAEQQIRGDLGLRVTRGRKPRLRSSGKSRRAAVAREADRGRDAERKRR